MLKKMIAAALIFSMIAMGGCSGTSESSSVESVVESSAVSEESIAESSVKSEESSDISANVSKDVKEFCDEVVALADDLDAFMTEYSEMQAQATEEAEKYGSFAESPNYDDILAKVNELEDTYSELSDRYAELDERGQEFDEDTMSSSDYEYLMNALQQLTNVTESWNN